MERDVALHAEPFQAVIRNTKVRRASHQSVNLVTLLQEKLGEIGTILPRYAGDECSLGHGFQMDWGAAGKSQAY